MHGFNELIMKFHIINNENIMPFSNTKTATTVNHYTIIAKITHLGINWKNTQNTNCYSDLCEPQDESGFTTLKMGTKLNLEFWDCVVLEICI